MRERSLRYRLEYAIYAGAKRLVLALPHSTVRRLGNRLGGWSFHLAGSRRRLILDNMERALPEIPAAERLRLTRACFAHFGAVFLETVSAERFDEQEVDRRFEIEGWEHVERARQAGRGLFVLTGHYGNWELAMYPLARRLGELHFIARPPNNPFVAEDVARIRERLGAVPLPRKRAAHGMLNVLRRGGSVAVVIDQRVLPQNGILVPFLGQPAWTSPIVATLALHLGTPAVTGFCYPLPDGRYRFTLEPPIFPEGRGADAVAALTGRYLERVERHVRERPELWMWMHRRWQLTHRHEKQHSLDRIRRECGLPPELTFEALAGSGLAEAALGELRALADAGFLERSAGVCIVGAVGDRATRAACALGDALVTRGHPVRYESAEALLDRLLAADAAGELGERLVELDAYELLILDDLGERELTTAQGAMLGRLLDQRLGRRATLVACRQPPERWHESFRSAPALAAALERWRGASRVIELERDAA